MSLMERVCGIAADVLKVPASQLTGQSSTETIEAWDSVQHLNLVLALEQEFAVQFEPEEIDQMTSVERILKVLEAKLQPSA
ncbi:MAG TPA: acyl carrier protein [Terriglobales bacterium]|jgi:acyl carrier protein